MATDEDSTQSRPLTPLYERDKAVSRGLARDAFCAALHTHAPHVLADLAAEPLRGYALLAARYQPGDAAHLMREERRSLRWVLRDHGIVLPWEGESPLVIWAQAYHLNAPWFVERAMRTLRRWHDSGRPPDAHLHLVEDMRMLAMVGSYEGSRAPLIPPTWDPQFESRSSFRRRARAALHAQLEEHIRAIEQSVRANGMKATTERPSLEAHMAWLVWYQVEGLSYAAVAARAQEQAKAEQSKAPWYDLETVKVEIIRTGRLLDLPVRHGKPGRPRRGKSPGRG